MHSIIDRRNLRRVWGCDTEIPKAIAKNIDFKIEVGLCKLYSSLSHTTHNSNRLEQTQNPPPPLRLGILPPALSHRMAQQCAVPAVALHTHIHM